jgi:hypothetical protein
MKPISLFVIFVPLFGSMIVLAARAPVQPPPSQPFEFSDWPASMSKEPTKGLTLGTFRIRFEATTLAEVQRAAHAGSIEQQGDAGEHILWLCYTGKHRGISERIWIISSGEMGGAEHAVTAITATALNRADPNSGCPFLPTTMQPVSLDTPLWLGSSDAEVEGVLGSPSHSDGPWRSYDFKADSPSDCGGEGAQLGNWLVTKLKGGRVIAIYAGQVTSC